MQLDAGLYLCRLIRCAFTDGEVPGALPEGVTLGRVYALARKNSVEGVSCYGVLKGDYPDDAELVEKWKSAIDKTLMRQAYFDTEREEILCAMAKAGLSYLLLKGVRLANRYPLPGMRSMADNDILYGMVEPDPRGGFRIRGDSVKKAQEIMAEIMIGRGYEIESLKGNHDTYHKRPFYNFEMHRDIVPEHDPSYEYYRNPWKRAVPVEGGDGYEYTFSEEDDYIYNLAHMHMHFTTVGCGIRHIVDQYVIHSSIGESLDREYIRRELEHLGMVEFHEKIQDIMKALFLDDGELTEEQKELLLFLVGAGTYGNRASQFDNAMQKIGESAGSGFKAKMIYLKNRIILPDDVCKRTYPAFYGKPYLTPVLVVYRLGKGIIGGSGRLWREIKMLVRHK